MYELNKVNGRDNLRMRFFSARKFVLPVSCFYVSNLQCHSNFLQVLCHFCLKRLSSYYYSRLCVACILLLSMSEEGFSEVSASDMKSATLDTDALRKIIKETVCEELSGIRKALCIFHPEVPFQRFNWGSFHTADSINAFSSVSVLLYNYSDIHRGVRAELHFVTITTIVFVLHTAVCNKPERL